MRIIVLTSGRLLLFAGSVLILTLSLRAYIQGFAVLLWLAVGHYELRRTERGYRNCTAIRVHSDGGVEVRNNDRAWRPGRLLAGSTLLKRLGWLRIQTIDGDVIHELLCGNAREDRDWRRLQVIWRHIGALP